MGYIIEQHAQGKAQLAFIGDRNKIWHRLGNQMLPGQSVEEWAKASGLDFTVTKVRAFAELKGFNNDTLQPAPELLETDRYFLAREDIKAILSPGVVSDQYRIDELQPIDVLRFAARYTGVDKRFQLDAAGMLDNGAKIWATATFNGDMKVAGERHIARLLLSTTYDASACSTAAVTVIRAICDNSLKAALDGSGNTQIKVRHNSRFNAEQVSRELAVMAQAIERFKAMGDAMAAFELSSRQLGDFFNTCLDIPLGSKPDDVSKRKQNQRHDLDHAYIVTVREGAPKLSTWAALQALTRYVDHDRSTRNGGADESAKRFQSAQWGSGDQLKTRGMDILRGILKDAGKLPELVNA